MDYKLSESLEDYLEAIAELIAKDGHAHSKEIAIRLNVKMPSVTNALRQLDEMQLIVYNTHYPVVLTADGEKIASRIMHRHAVLKNFFSNVLGVELQKASDTACRLEHVVDEKIIDRFVLFSEAISHRTDAKSLQVYLTEAMHFGDGDGQFCVISELHSGQRATVQAFSRNISNGEERSSLAVNDSIELQAVSLDQTHLRVAKQGTIIELPMELAENIWVKIE